METKRRRIIEMAIPFFAKKGVHATSIQEIAEAAGMAKGTLYLYFKSKDDLFDASVHYVLERIEALVANHPVEADAPRQGFRHWLIEQIRFALAYRDFFIMLLNESGMAASDGIHQKLFLQRINQLQHYCNYVKALYGNKAAPFAMDAAAMMQAVVTQYCAHALLDGADIDARVLADFLMDRLDDWMNGLMKSGKAPILREAGILRLQGAGHAGLNGLEGDIRLLREALQEETAHPSEREEGLLYLQVVENELRKPRPVSAVIEGILTSLAASPSPAVSRAAGRLAEKVKSATLRDGSERE